MAADALSALGCGSEHHHGGYKVITEPVQPKDLPVILPMKFPGLSGQPLDGMMGSVQRDAASNSPATNPAPTLLLASTFTLRDQIGVN